MQHSQRDTATQDGEGVGHRAEFSRETTTSDGRKKVVSYFVVKRTTFVVTRSEVQLGELSSGNIQDLGEFARESDALSVAELMSEADK